MSGSKRHDPTPKRYERARREGKFIKAPLCTHLSALIACCFTVVGLLPNALVRSRMLLEYYYSQGLTSPEHCLWLSFAIVGGSTIVIVGAVALSAGVCELAQLGWRVGFSERQWRLSHLDPISGGQGLWVRLKSSWQLPVRFLILVLCLAPPLRDLTLGCVPALSLDSGQVVRFFSAQLLSLVWHAGIALLGCAGIEYFCNRMRYRTELMMNDQEIKDELRESEGDPLVRAIRRGEHQALSLQEITKRVRQSRVIIVSKDRS